MDKYDTFFEQTYVKYTPRLKQYARRLILDEFAVQDIIQDVFCKFLEKNEVFDDSKNIKSYLFTSVHNACINYLKHYDVEQKYMSAFVYELKSQELFMVDFWELEGFEDLRSEKLDKIKNAIDVLPKQCREVFLLNKFECLKYKGILMFC